MITDNSVISNAVKKLIIAIPSTFIDAGVPKLGRIEYCYWICQFTVYPLSKPLSRRKYIIGSIFYKIIRNIDISHEYAGSLFQCTYISRIFFFSVSYSLINKDWLHALTIMQSTLRLVPPFVLTTLIHLSFILPAHQRVSPHGPTKGK